LKALVTGGAGFIGSNLVKALVSSGNTVDVVDDMSAGSVENLSDLEFRTMLTPLMPYWEQSGCPRPSSGLMVFEGDMEEENIVNRIVSGQYDVIFHLAANPRVSFTVEHPALTTDINVIKSLVLLEAVQKCKTPVRFIFSSTCALYGDTKQIPTSEDVHPNPSSPYGLQKLFIEDYIRMASKLHGIDAVSLRYFNVYGPGQHGGSAYATAITAWCHAVKNGLPLRSDGDGEQTRDMVYVGDVVRANILAALKYGKFQGESINVGTGKRFSNNYILNLFKKEFGRKEGFSIVLAPARVGDVRDTQADISYSFDSIGYQPAVQFEQGLKYTWNWWGIR